LRPETLVCRS